MKSSPFKSLLFSSLLLAGMASSSCTNDPYVQRGRVGGTALGGVVGGVIGNNTGLGSVGGAAIGAALGGIMGDTAGKTNSNYHRGRYY